MPKYFVQYSNKHNPVVNIKRDFYAMSTTFDGDEAEIIMYGDIVQEIPRDWWTGEPLQGNYIVLDDFIDDLDKIKNAKKITVRINSCGGDAYAAIPIHNRLRELKADVTTIVDGVAMSGGSLIMCAADKVLVNPSSLIMIHKCWCFLFGGYNADELRAIANSNDAVDKAQAAIYMRKTGIGEADLLSMMADQTYMTGGEAVEKGFADALTDDEPVKIAASTDRLRIYVNGRERHLPFPLSGLPENFPTVKPEAVNPASVTTGKHLPKPSATDNTEGGTFMPTTLEELRKGNPDLADAIMAEAQAALSSDAGNISEAVEAERKRIKEIDEMSALFDDETVREAKYGANPCTVQEMVYRAAQKAVQEGKKFMSELKADNKNSGAQNVEAVPGDDDVTSDTKKDANEAGKRAANKYKNTIGGKKNE